MAAFNKFNTTVQYWIEGNTNYNGDTFLAMLSNTSPSATQSTYSSISSSELGTGGGYSVGGATVTMGVSNSSGTETVTASASSPTWTGSGTGFGPFRYVTIYDSSASTKALQSWYDYGSSISLNSGDTFTLNFGANYFTLS